MRVVQEDQDLARVLVRIPWARHLSWRTFCVPHSALYEAQAIRRVEGDRGAFIHLKRHHKPQTAIQQGKAKSRQGRQTRLF